MVIGEPKMLRARYDRGHFIRNRPQKNRRRAEDARISLGPFLKRKHDEQKQGEYSRNRKSKLDTSGENTEKRHLPSLGISSDQHRTIKFKNDNLNKRLPHIPSNKAKREGNGTSGPHPSDSQKEHKQGTPLQQLNNTIFSNQFTDITSFSQQLTSTYTFSYFSSH